VTSPLARGVVDTPILIHFREGDPAAVQFILELRSIADPDVSQWSILCLFVWAQSASDRDSVELARDGSNVVPISTKISKRAAAIMEALPSPSPLTAGDAIVAATALELKLPLYTLDPARFAAVPKLTTIQPY
jgi:predicted nucleic acid-binding protein